MIEYLTNESDSVGCAFSYTRNVTLLIAGGLLAGAVVAAALALEVARRIVRR